MADGNAARVPPPQPPPPSSSCRGRRCGGGAGGCGLALGRLVRKLRRQSKMLCTAAAASGGAAPAASRCQYDPLSYARNFDRSGFGAALDDDDGDVSTHLYRYTFASRFVLASSARQPQ